MDISLGHSGDAWNLKKMQFCIMTKNSYHCMFLIKNPYLQFGMNHWTGLGILPLYIEVLKNLAHLYCMKL